jgi:hypothetical protein
MLHRFTFLISILAGLAIASLMACGQITTNNPAYMHPKQNDLPVFDTSNTAILPLSMIGNYVFDSSYTEAQLTREDMEKIDGLFRGCIDRYNLSMRQAKPAYIGIDLKSGKYKRQIIAATSRKGEKEVWINCFCQTHDRNWKTQLIEVDDGGECYFNMKINLSEKRCYDLVVNGSA